MSNKYLSRAFPAKTGSAARKLVLVKIADQASDTGEAFPSYQHIADHAEMTRRNVMRHVHELQQAGYLQIRRRLYREEDGSRLNRSNIFILTIDDQGEPTGGGDTSVTRWCHQCHQGGDTSVTRNHHRNQNPGQGGTAPGVDTEEDAREDSAEEVTPW